MNSIKRHLHRVAERGCALCLHLGYGRTPGEIHHLREAQGMAQRGDDALVICACPDHHRGKHGIHGDKSAWTNARYSEMDALAETIRELYL